MSLIASLANIRCHTCRFAPSQREATLAPILKPCTLSFTVSRNEGHGTRVNCNMSDLCLNVSPHSIAVIQKSVQAFLDSMAIKEAMAQGPDSTEKYGSKNKLKKYLSFSLRFTMNRTMIQSVMKRLRINEPKLKPNFQLNRAPGGG